MLPLLLSALFQEGIYLFLLRYSHAVEKNFQLLPIFLAGWGALFLLYLLSLRWTQQQLRQSEPEHSHSKEIFWLGMILVAGLVFRITALFLPLLLSDDLYYYMWYGRLQFHGINPYLYTVNAPELAWLRDPFIWQNIPFKDIFPVYPAFIMKCFYFAYLLGADSVLHFKLLQFIPETVTCLAGMGLLKSYDKSPRLILIYAWCPLPIIEYLGMGHGDAWGVAALTVFLYLFKERRMLGSALAFSLSVLVKWVPILFLPLIWKKLTWKHRLIWGLTFLGGIAVLYLPFLSARSKSIGFLPTFMTSYEFNGSLYKILRLGITRADVTHWIVNLLIVFWAFLVASFRWDWPKALLWTLLGFFSLTYLVYPWYLGYLLPLLMLSNCWGAWAWLFTSILSYQVLIPYRTEGRWEEATFILWLEYLPVYLLVFLQWAEARKLPCIGRRGILSRPSAGSSRK